MGLGIREMQYHYVTMVLEWLVVLLLLLVSFGEMAVITKPGCPQTCGSVTIPYPFGTSRGCSYNESFIIDCLRIINNNEISNDSSLSPRPYFHNNPVAIIDLSVSEGEIRVESPVSRACYSELGNITTNEQTATITDSVFPLSTRNKFTAVGCDTVGLVAGLGGRYYVTGCVALCDAMSDVINGTCTGIGCCEMQVNEDIFDFQTNVQGLLLNHTLVHDFNPCSFAFVAEDGAYTFSSDHLRNLSDIQHFPVVLNWAVGDHLTCQQAKAANLSDYACIANNSDCLDSAHGPGYQCKCSSGFEGNPYLPNGCEDINECETISPSPCNSTCVNSVGSFHCSCPDGYGGDGFTNGTGCFPSHRNSAARTLSIALGLCIGLLALLVGASWIYWVLKKRKLIQLKQKFFQENGGLLLQQQLALHGGPTTSETAKVFSADELSKATNNYHESRVLGQGGYGTVYKGVLSDNKVVAIKKSKIGDQSQIEQFVNEVIVLSQINHRNVVKLLGCCLETQVPLLVYEFITNGTVADHLHDTTNDGKYTSLSWDMRLKIAAETAGAIAYLHSSASMPIIHRDIKTANVLLDENYTAKVSDFGASRLVPLDQTQLTTLVQGTLGYLDPEYFHSSQLTDKSDVYSFGVVLAELLTGEKALSFTREERDRNLAMYFATCMKEDRLIEIVDKKLASGEEHVIEQIKVFANVAKACLRVRGEDRPTMKEVANELEGLCKQKKSHPWETHDDHVMNLEESEKLIMMGVQNEGASTGFDSITVENLKPYSDGR